MDEPGGRAAACPGPDKAGLGGFGLHRVESEHIPIPSGVSFFFKLMPPPERSRREVCSADGAPRAPARRSLRGNGLFSVISSLFRRPRFYIPAMLTACALIGAAVYASRRHAAPPELAFSEFVQQVDRGQVKRIRSADGTLTVTLADGTTAITVAPAGFFSDPAFATSLAR